MNEEVFRKLLPIGRAVWALVACGLFLGISAPASRSAGILRSTGYNSDVSILGQGLFLLKRPSDGRLFVTRAGEFRVDQFGFLVSGSGLRLLGSPDVTSGRLEELSIDWDIPYPVGVYARAWSFRTNGMVVLELSDNSFRTNGQVLLQRPIALPELAMTRTIREGSHVFAIDPSRVCALAPATSEVGWLQSGVLEEESAPRLEILPPGGAVDPFKRGRIFCTGIATDFALDGPGFFVVRDVTNGERLLTRAGAFRFDPEGFLVNLLGHRVQGRSTNAGMPSIDVRLPTPSAIPPRTALRGISVEANGDLVAAISDGTSLLFAKMLIASAERPERLLAKSENHYGDAGEAGVVFEGDLLDSIDHGGVLQNCLDLDLFGEALLERRKRVLNHVQGAISRTGQEDHLAIAGDGFFILRHPATGQRFATRCGNFMVTADGYYELNGLRLQGETNPLAVGIGDVRLARSVFASPAAKVVARAVGGDGDVFQAYSDGSSFSSGRVLLQLFRNPNALRPAFTNVMSEVLPDFGPVGGRGDWIYAGFDDALPDGPMQIPGDPGIGSIQTNALEMMPDPFGLELVRLGDRVGIQMVSDLLPLPSGNYRFEWSTNLVDWTSMTGNSSAVWSTNGAMFFRASVEPLPPPSSPLVWR